jgi:hypothetical protein
MNISILRPPVHITRPQRLRGLRRGASRFLAGTVGSNPSGGMDICLLCVLSGRGLCDELITRLEDSY